MSSCNPNAITVRDVCSAAARAIGDLQTAGRLPSGHSVIVSNLGWIPGSVLLVLLDAEHNVVTKVPDCAREALDGVLTQFLRTFLLDTPGTWTEMAT